MRGKGYLSSLVLEFSNLKSTHSCKLPSFLWANNMGPALRFMGVGLLQSASPCAPATCFARKAALSNVWGQTLKLKLELMLANPL